MTQPCETCHCDWRPPRAESTLLVPPLKRERTESSRGRLNIRVSITEFYLRSPGRFAGLFFAGSKKRKPHFGEAGLSMGL